MKLMAKKMSRKKQRLLDVFGWYGVAAILLAYVLISFEVTTAKSWAYQALNFTGAIGLATISVTKHARQPAIVNLVWAAIALVALVATILKWSS
jgi:hypothetical protein